ncbi:hypothetical protein GCM10010274_58080 [Streptomyces lavendofoliae]|uniref:Uncharacterized protein n=1 Tax=Streptomyces lavendofoliae TaxID=67314 RepID=A0A918I327_9ACTN|nr:hypothetical protein GCM10010274_58080 [Streptomyces lavendofoliae]
MDAAGEQPAVRPPRRVVEGGEEWGTLSPVLAGAHGARHDDRDQVAMGGSGAVVVTPSARVPWWLVQLVPRADERKSPIPPANAGAAVPSAVPAVLPGS